MFKGKHFIWFRTLGIVIFRKELVQLRAGSGLLVLVQDTHKKNVGKTRKDLILPPIKCPSLLWGECVYNFL